MAQNKVDVGLLTAWVRTVTLDFCRQLEGRRSSALDSSGSREKRPRIIHRKLASRKAGVLEVG